MMTAWKHVSLLGEVPVYEKYLRILSVTATSCSPSSSTQANPCTSTAQNMAYPGEGYRMSNYGRKTYTPEQVKEMWRESTDKEAKIAKGHNATQQLAEKKPDLSKPRTYFDNHKTYRKEFEYDQTFCINEGYNQKLKRDDMQHTQGLNIRGEEETKPVPILSNSVYGRGAPLEQMKRDCVRVAVVRRQFYRSSGMNMQHS